MPVASAITFYAWFESMSHRWAAEAGLPDSHANAIKHARAAYEVHQALHWMHFPNPERAVLALGQSNEWAEQRLRGPVDSTGEIMKDMANNYAGIVAAQWRNAHMGVTCSSELNVYLAQNNVLRATPEAVTQEPGKVDARADIGAALQWLEERKPIIRKQVEGKLNGCAEN